MNFSHLKDFIILNEDDKITEIANKIKSECSSFLKAYELQKGKFIFRGIKSSEPILIKNIRTDRLPIDTPLDLHQEYDKVFKKLGLKATRSNSIFCSANLNTAKDWGAAYIIFVKDGWVGTVFDKVKRDYVYDMVTSKNDLENTLIKLEPRSFNSTSELSDILKYKYYDILFHSSSFIGLKYDALSSIEILKLLNLEILHVETVNKYISIFKNKTFNDWKVIHFNEEIHSEVSIYFENKKYKTYDSPKVILTISDNDDDWKIFGYRYENTTSKTVIKQETGKNFEIKDLLLFLSKADEKFK